MVDVFCNENGTTKEKAEVLDLFSFLSWAEEWLKRVLKEEIVMVDMDSIILDFVIIGTIKDEKKAFHWYLESAEKGNNVVQYDVGCCYLNEIETMEDEEKAFQWYLKSAEGGNNEEKAFQWYLKSAEEGNSNRLYNLKYCYMNGIRIAKDEKKVLMWISLPAEGRCDEFEITTVEKYQNKLKLNTNGKNINLSFFKLSTRYLNNIEDLKDLNVENHNCCICWQKNKLTNMKIFPRAGTGNDYSELKDIEYLDKEGFGTIWKSE
ncbi:hypothetical protein Glove_64g91 [Diversispora epigaea]|uniref:Sel1 repeat protein n=1 Tax=Diversispora epigaea TaxID=1348612 RepID=A0A397JKW0_9GLOM|nr:hypothetical protein Glove_64g91 [Diversispora epigaea]